MERGARRRHLLDVATSYLQFIRAIFTATTTICSFLGEGSIKGEKKRLEEE